MTKLQKMMIDLHFRIINEDYYTDIYYNTVYKHGMLTAWLSNGSYPDAKIVDFANDFWLDLPDAPEIRIGPFWLLCDIAEHCFDED